MAPNWVLLGQRRGVKSGTLSKTPRGKFQPTSNQSSLSFYSR